ncbi:CAP domain-containing protein [Aquabacterium sp. A7-Y]|uniref:CAP domain-containing protein n=1 Tax=Aquabacterium sp. A7-Y TaxID=1349605 RepID=UPI00223CC7F1|nr:CAP domain-containing protein [Aquabacterium sp. A7-Y]MCW7539762.1 CAP domain-containing protein [Aquabacterium sp. A7-Y]
MPSSSAAQPRLRVLFAVTLAGGLAACGGGGGSGDDSATGTGGGTEAPAPGPAASPAAVADCGLPDFRAEALRLINQHRTAGAVCGRQGRFDATKALTWSDRLAQAAAGHSADMANHDYFSHTSRDGTSFSQRIQATGYRGATLAENIAAGQSSVQEVVNSWMDSEGHCVNIMTADYTEFGLACVAGPGSYGRYWTMNLAAPR